MQIQGRKTRKLIDAVRCALRVRIVAMGVELDGESDLAIYRQAVKLGIEPDLGVQSKGDVKIQLLLIARQMKISVSNGHQKSEKNNIIGKGKSKAIDYLRLVNSRISPRNDFMVIQSLIDQDLIMISSLHLESGLTQELIKKIYHDLGKDDGWNEVLAFNNITKAINKIRAKKKKSKKFLNEYGKPEKTKIKSDLKRKIKKTCRVDPASDDFLRTYAWRELRMKALKTYGRRCMCCGTTPNDGAIMNVDHIKPRRKYPDLALEFDNLQVLCNECNHGKGNWDETDYRPKTKAQVLKIAN